jgi:hypothetical protein
MILITFLLCCSIIIVSLSTNLLLSSSSSSSSAVFVTAAWASSSGWNHPQYRTTKSLSSSQETKSFTTNTWGCTIPKPSRHTLQKNFRGGNQDHQKGYCNSKLSMTDTAATSASTAEGIIQLMASSGLSMENYNLLSDRGKMAILNLICYDSEYHDQTHIYQDWPPPGTDDSNKIRLSEQVKFKKCFE